MKKYFIQKNRNLKEAISKLEKNDVKCLMVVSDNKNKLFGTLTDGDIRRALLQGANLKEKINKYVEQNPKKIEKSYLNKIQMIDVFSKGIDVIPVVDKNKNISSLLTKKNIKKFNISKSELKNISLIIMAGGKGTRMQKFSNYFPKALLPLGNSTAIDYIINFFSYYKIGKIFISVNYKKNLIKSYLKEKKNRKLFFLEEKSFLGSAGPLSLAQKKIKSDFFVINCDTIVKINLNNFYNFHKENNYDITIVAALKTFEFPYGACKVNKKGELTNIIEKPKYSNFSNVGLYLFKKRILKLIKKNELMNMDRLINIAKSKRLKIGVFPMNSENWIDVGEWDKYKNQAKKKNFYDK